MVVSGPCPLYTMVESGSVSNSRSMLFSKVSKSPPGRSVRPIEIDRGPGLGLEPRHAEHEVDVRMGEPDPDRTDALGRQLVGDQPRFLAGVDDGILGRRFIDHEVAVLYELVVGYRYDAHG